MRTSLTSLGKGVQSLKAATQKDLIGSSLLGREGAGVVREGLEILQKDLR